MRVPKTLVYMTVAGIALFNLPPALREARKRDNQRGQAEGLGADYLAENAEYCILPDGLRGQDYRATMRV